MIWKQLARSEIGRWALELFSNRLPAGSDDTHLPKARCVSWACARTRCQRSTHPTARTPTDNGRLSLVKRKPVILLLGSGWGAHSLMKVVDTDTYDVVVISPRNYFVFTPM